MTSLAGDLVVTSDDTINIPETTSIISSSKTNFQLVAVVLLAIACS